MSLTRLNLKNGLVNQALSTLMGAGRTFTPGKVIFVDSVTGSDGNLGTEPTLPMATIDAAINKTRASKGDLIIVFPKHTETISTASGITSDVVGVAIVGLGEGAERPTITFSATASTWVLSAASSSIYNIIAVPSIDSVVSPWVVSGPDCELDVEVQDASSTVECVRGILTTAAADRLKINLRYQGLTAGNAVVNAVRLVGGTGARVHVDFYGIASTAIVEFETTATVDTVVSGNFYVSGTTDLSKNVVDTATGSTWSVAGFDSAAGSAFSGGSGNAIAAGDLSAINANVLSQPICVEKTDGAVLTGNDDLFVITGGPIKVLSIVGIVTTVIGGSSNGDLQLVTTSPAATVDFNAAPVAINSDAAGTSYQSINTTGVFTPVTAGFVLEANSFATKETEYLCPAGTIHFRSSAAQTGVIAWYLRFVPLSPNSRVVAAA